MKIKLWILRNRLGRYWVQARGENNGHRAAIGNPRGYVHEYEAVAVAEAFRKDMDDSPMPGQSVHIISSTGERIS